jgi:hypothetical protein
MDYTVERFGSDFLIVSGGLPFRTPTGTPVVSACPELLTEVANNLQRHGSDPTKQFSMYSLQASHLDFTLRRPREALQSELVEEAPRDLWFSRPAYGVIGFRCAAAPERAASMTRESKTSP